jgi:hypothetical protein
LAALFPRARLLFCAPVIEARLLLAFGVMFGVGFRGFSGVVLGMQGVAVRCHGMMCSHFMCSGFVVLGRFAMMVRGGFVMLGSPLVVFCDFGCGGSHRDRSFSVCQMVGHTRPLSEISRRPGLTYT